MQKTVCIYINTVCKTMPSQIWKLERYGRDTELLCSIHILLRKYVKSLLSHIFPIVFFLKSSTYVAESWARIPDMMEIYSSRLIMDRKFKYLYDAPWYFVWKTVLLAFGSLHCVNGPLRCLELRVTCWLPFECLIFFMNLVEFWWNLLFFELWDSSARTFIDLQHK